MLRSVNPTKKHPSYIWTFNMAKKQLCYYVQYQFETHGQPCVRPLLWHTPPAFITAISDSMCCRLPIDGHSQHSLRDLSISTCEESSLHHFSACGEGPPHQLSACRKRVSTSILCTWREPVQKWSKKSALLGHLRTRREPLQKRSKKSALLGHLCTRRDTVWKQSKKMHFSASTHHGNAWLKYD